MAVIAVDKKMSGQANILRYTAEDFVVAPLTTGALKRQWVAPAKMRLRSVKVYSPAVGAGGTSTIIDVNKNGTTIFTTQANRPTLLLANSGFYTIALPPEIVMFDEGDIISYDVDQITTTGPANTSVSLEFTLV